MLDLRAGEKQAVLDIGCGTGELLGRLAQVVRNDSKLIGLDALERSIAQAKTDHPNVEFICYKFDDRLPFPDKLFDVVVSIDTIECIKNKQALLSEIHRVLKPCGKVLAMHWDWDTQTYSVKNKNLARKAVWAFSDWKQPWMDDCDGQMGRKLWGLFEGSNKFHGRPDTFCLLETKFEPGHYGFDRMQDLAALVSPANVDQEDYEALKSELSESHANGQYLYSVTSFIYLGQKI
ncbi:SAM-dependent methyltransferase [Nitrospira sp. KM1]|nr:SAM-dependent methyltransferase [Nitrospira sp. KM1]